MKMTTEVYRELNGLPPQTRSKFGNIKTDFNGRTFDSKKEATRAGELELLKKAGEVTEVEYQPEFPVVVNGKKICKYIADFRVTYADGHVEVEDVKGMRTQVYRIKKKMVEALYGIKIIEV